MIGQLDGKSDQDLQDLAAYFNQEDMPLGQADPELVDLGGSLYRGGNLASGVAACAAVTTRRARVTSLLATRTWVGRTQSMWSRP